jgi:hypothetical protein
MKRQMMISVLLSVLLSACGDGDSKPTTTNFANAPAAGTPISAVTKTEAAPTTPSNSEYTEIAWEDLELPGQGMADIMKKYQPQIDAIPESRMVEDKALMDKMQAEMNAAPINPALNGKKIKLPGFITPLEIDETKGMVKEFLLVPYFGACIHVPPPPLNQTLYVKPMEGKSIGAERLYEPVWVYGTLSTDKTHTNLADAGYQIKDASVEIWKAPEQDKKSTH